MTAPYTVLRCARHAAGDIPVCRLKMLSEANGAVVCLEPAQAIGLLNDPATAFIDLREPPELEKEGVIPGAIHAPRGMLEFYIDPAMPYHKPVFSSGKKLVLYCASGGRSALGAQTALSMGVQNVGHLAGGLKAWKEAGGPLAPAVLSAARPPERRAYLAGNGNSKTTPLFRYSNPGSALARARASTAPGSYTEVS